MEFTAADLAKARADGYSEAMAKLHEANLELAEHLDKLNTEYRVVVEETAKGHASCIVNKKIMRSCDYSEERKYPKMRQSLIKFGCINE